MTKPLFDNFEKVSSKVWKQKIQLDLKGADYNKSLIWNSPEGIDVRPFYHPDDIKSHVDPVNTKATSWKIAQNIYVKDAETANKKALQLKESGVESIVFVIPSSDIELPALMKSLDPTSTPVHFHMQFLSEDFVENIMKLHPAAGIYCHLDIIGNLTRSGNWYTNLNEDHNIIKKVIGRASKYSNLFSVDTALYQNAGANMVQQLAYALAHANEYLNFVENAGIVSEPFLSMSFNVAVGSNYFFEIAKLRALRVLFKTLASEYGCFDTDCHIFAIPSNRNKTIYDYNSNMLRTTTECMSAILGGANTISNLSYDAIYHKDNDFGERISRNQLLVLKNESYFDKVNNPADGTYYIEYLTQQMAQKALSIFKEIETGGGFLHQLKEGTIQRKIKESATKEQDRFDSGDMILLGSNKYPNPQDIMKHELEIYPFLKTKIRKTLIEPIIPRRLAERIEQERLDQEN
jgi:methylmalonyl-CoA mutase